MHNDRLLRFSSFVTVGLDTLSWLNQYNDCKRVKKVLLSIAMYMYIKIIVL